MRITQYLVLISFGLLFLFVACKGPPSGDFTSSDTRADSSRQTSTNAGLTDSKVEAAIASLLSDWRFGGSVRVKGIQEIPQQNAAVADLKFENFEFAINGTDQLIRARDFKPPKKSGQMMPSYEEVFPSRKVTYSRQGKATLTKYNDGRWVLKRVNWHDGIACCGVTGSVEIR